MKRSNTARAARGVLALTLLTVGLAPSISHAAAPVISYFNVATYPITPYNSGEVRFVGNISNITTDTKITVWARDTLIDYSKFHDPRLLLVWYSNDPGNGHAAGDFEGRIAVTDLGTHDGTVSPIDIFLQAQNAANEKSDIIAQRVFKHSADPGGRDVYNPATPNVRQSPPPSWCHTLSSGPGGCFDGSFRGRQTLLPICKTPAIGVPALTPPSPLPPIGPIPIIPSQNIPQFNGFPCYLPLHNGHAQIAGTVVDATSASFGIASEIKDVVVTVANSAGQVIQTFRSFFRTNTSAHFNVGLEITDYNPGSYTWKVTASDALGHTSEKTGTFSVQSDGCPNPPIC